MKVANCLLASILVLAGCAFTQAQTAGTAVPRTNTQIIDFILNLQEQRLVDLAEVMPAEKYSFVPKDGAFTGVLTFAEQLKHIAADNYILGAGILGESIPGDVGPHESGSKAVQGKPAVIAYLKASFVYMRRASAAIDDSKMPIATPAISPWPAGTATRLGLAIETCVHTWDHYGQLIEYLRMNGIIPPASK